jgi:hypothetical protein
VSCHAGEGRCRRGALAGGHSARACLTRARSCRDADLPSDVAPRRSRGRRLRSPRRDVTMSRRGSAISRRGATIRCETLGLWVERFGIVAGGGERARGCSLPNSPRTSKCSVSAQQKEDAGEIHPRAVTHRAYHADITQARAAPLLAPVNGTRSCEARWAATICVR